MLSTFEPIDLQRSRPLAATRTVLLRHFDIPPEAGLGGDHYDWMIEPWEGSPALITFRLHNRIDLPHLEPWTFAGERLADHRRDYLTYEGHVSGGRGTVQRVASGQCVSIEELGDSLTVVVQFEGANARPVRLVGHKEGGSYTFTATSVDVP
jgi:hypothetical protein